MKKLWKRVLCLTMVVLMVITAVACAAKTEKEESAAAEAEVQEPAEKEESAAAEAEVSEPAEKEEAEANEPVTLTVMGNEVVYEKAPERVVVNSLENVQIMIALGLEDKIIGYTNGHFKIEEFLEEYQAPMKALHFLGSDATFETVLAENADFVFGSAWTFRETGLAPAEDCIANGIDYYCISSGVTNMATMELFYEDILNLGKILV